MPHKSLREIRADLRRLHSSDRYVDALLVVQAPDGSEIYRVGGRWDRLARAYVAGADARLQVARLQESQVINKDGSPGVAYGFARWLEAVRRGDKQRPRLTIAGGNRGSGKTYFLGGVAMPSVALEFPGSWAFGVNINSDNRRECVAHIEDVCGPGWIASQSEDLRDLWTEFVTGARIKWLSAQNPRKLRQAGLPIRYILLNEGQEMPEVVFDNAIGGIRNLGGLVGVATNPPQAGRSDWVAVYWNAIESGELGHRGEIHHLDNKLNQAVDQVALDDIAVILRAGNPDAADADAEGLMKLSGPIAYKNFKALPVEKGGHIGDPPPTPQVGKAPWRDVTRERTAEDLGGGEGRDWIIGADFQRRPGIVGVACKLFLVEREWPELPLAPGTLALWAAEQINCPGDETAFSDALERRGYTPHGLTPDGRPAPSALIVGDGTGARQNAAHKWDLPPSFTALKAYGGWLVIPPRYTRKRKPDNPTVKESRGQMWDAFNARAILISPRLKTGEEGFPALVSSLQRAKVNGNGNLVGGNHHGPDGLRYVAWRFLPRPQPPRPSPDLDTTTYDQFRGIRLLNG